MVDVWKTREAHKQRAQEQIDPHGQQVEAPGPSETTYCEAHNAVEA